MKPTTGKPWSHLLAIAGTIECLVLSLAVAVVDLVATNLTGKGSVIELITAGSAPIDNYSGIWLSGEILKVVLGLTFLATVWAVYLASEKSRSLSLAGLIAGTVSGVSLIIAARYGIIAAALAGAGQPTPDATLIALAGRAAAFCFGLWAVAVALPIRGEKGALDSAALLGAAVGLAGIVELVVPSAGFVFFPLSILWWPALGAALSRRFSSALKMETRAKELYVYS